MWKRPISRLPKPIIVASPIDAQLNQRIVDLASTYIEDRWHELRFGEVHIIPIRYEGFSVEVEVYFGDLDPRWIQVELFANSPNSGGDPICILHDPRQGAMAGMVNAFCYQATIPKSPTPNHYTARIRPSHPDANIPGEVQYILWQLVTS